ncbi:substrate-binding domain-containing protein [Actinomadura sp. WMMA1423]|uniref:autoinducer 2 ABC transporter substrate-binding protein n=1 Tax=Actinomadura sp. WMMA1423 TaxID=2591108 RepID=UPI00143D0ECB|nr:substrate-binding domain-containing protein [Actinomadura sp. WMMA1423]
MATFAAGCGGTVGNSGVATEKGGQVRIAMIPKFTSDPYFKAAEQGGRAAAAELGVSFSFNGPVDADVSKQSDLVDQYVQQRYSAITVSANDANAIAPALKRAQAAGVKVSTFDADAAPDSRQTFLNQATFAGMGQTLVDMMARQTDGRGNFLIVTAVLTAPNQNRWIAEMRKYIAAKYPEMKIKAVLPGNEDLAKSRQVTLDYLRAHKEINGVWAVTGIATPGVAQAVKELGLKGKVAITGLGVPSLVRPFIKDGTIKEVCLWNPTDIGYAAVHMAKAQVDGTLKPGVGNHLDAGRLGRLEFIAPDTILLGKPLIFDAKNIDSFHF